MRRSFFLAAALLSLSTSAAHAQRATASTDSLLDRLVGDWHMEGRVRGKPVAYTLAACRVLGGRYVELHTTDVQRPPQYEARVFVGADTTPGRVIVHWLDAFGAAYSVPHATGTVSGDTLRFDFAYASGPFRDTFVHDRATGRWSFKLESGDGKGGWRPFADYDVRRASSASSATGCG